MNRFLTKLWLVSFNLNSQVQTQIRNKKIQILLLCFNWKKTGLHRGREKLYCQKRNDKGFQAWWTQEAFSFSPFPLLFSFVYWWDATATCTHTVLKHVLVLVVVVEGELALKASVIVSVTLQRGTYGGDTRPLTAEINSHWSCCLTGLFSVFRALSKRFSDDLCYFIQQWFRFMLQVFDMNQHESSRMAERYFRYSHTSTHKNTA